MAPAEVLGFEEDGSAASLPGCDGAAVAGIKSCCALPTTSRHNRLTRSADRRGAISALSKVVVGGGAAVVKSMPKDEAAAAEALPEVSGGAASSTLSWGPLSGPSVASLLRWTTLVSGAGFLSPESVCTASRTERMTRSDLGIAGQLSLSCFCMGPDRRESVG